MDFGYLLLLNWCTLIQYTAFEISIIISQNNLAIVLVLRKLLEVHIHWCNLQILY